MDKILIPLHDNDIAPRFDLATDVLEVIFHKPPSELPHEEKVLVMARASADELSRFVITEKVNTVICAGIEEQYLQFLTWKGIKVIADVMGPVDAVLNRYFSGNLKSGDILYPLEQS
ncbi:MAG: NifB/NifX family molybdenum-iron cluster-binding protein [Desulfovibrio sp.]